jgi:hypothetical protein
MTSRALIIAPSEYQDPGITSYEEIANSGRRYEEFLKEDRLWKDSRIERLTKEQLTSTSSVMDAVTAAANAADKDDTLLVIYVGHGYRWADIPDADVHFAVESSRSDAPYTWLSTWYLYRAMRQSEASLKVLITDCCYSNYLNALGPGDLAEKVNDYSLGAFRDETSGTCVLTAVKGRERRAQATRCESGRLPSQYRDCTPFSGHLLNVLSKGLDNDKNLTLGMISRAVKVDMAKCSPHHPEPRMAKNDVPDETPLFSNHARRSLGLSTPITEDDWVEFIRQDRIYDLDDLLKEPEIAGRVYARLCDPSGDWREVAQRLNDRADQRYGDPDLFARYWGEATRALSS